MEFSGDFETHITVVLPLRFTVRKATVPNGRDADKSPTGSCHSTRPAVCGYNGLGRERARQRVGSPASP